jgi:hypothetical protein
MSMMKKSSGKYCNDRKAGKRQERIKCKMKLEITALSSSSPRQEGSPRMILLTV